MPFYFRKSVSAGPFRFNFSQHGVGASVGVKGFRIGTGPRGHYVHAGRGGFYYRATIGRPSARGDVTQPLVSRPKPALDADGMMPITSGSVLAMQDSAFAEILDDINAKNRQTRLSILLGLISSLPGIALALNFGSLFVLPALLLIVGATAFGAWLDSYKRAVVLFYDDGDVIAPIFQQTCFAFDELNACAGKWHIQSAKPVYDLTTWKRQAGAANLVTRKILSLSYRVPSIIKSNVTPPTIQAGRKVFYFLPDVILIEEGGVFGAISYLAIAARSQPSNFIEEQSVPRDTEILYHTWQHPNKGGGPDRRFKYNRQLPVCRYELLHLTSGSGVNELFEFSRFGAVQPFVLAIKNTPKQAGSEIRLLSGPEQAASQSEKPERERLLPRSATAALWLTGIISVAFIFVGMARLSPPSPPPVTAPAKPTPHPMFVEAASLNCRSAPSTTSDIVTTFQRGKSVSVIDRQNDWSEIAVEDKNCWSSSAALSETAPHVPIKHQRHARKHRSQTEPETQQSTLPEIY